MIYRVNLLPLELQPKPLFDKKRIIITAGVTLIIALAVMGGASLVYRFYSIHWELASANMEMASLQPVEKKSESMKAEIQKLEQEINGVKTLKNSQQSWSAVMNDISSVVPLDIWLADVDVNYDEKVSGQQSASAPGNGQGGAGKAVAPFGGRPAVPALPTQQDKIPPLPNVMVINGVSRSVPSIGVFVHNLSEFKAFSKVRLDKFAERKEDGALDFTITCYLQDGGGKDVAKAQ